jgi:hypothetical protein
MVWCDRRSSMKALFHAGLLALLYARYCPSKHPRATAETLARPVRHS